jgi:putative membrane protein
MMRLLSLVCLLFALIMGLSFAVLNAESVMVRYYIGSANMPLSVLILGIWVFGIVIGILASFPKILRLKLEIRRLRRDHS